MSEAEDKKESGEPEQGESTRAEHPRKRRAKAVAEPPQPLPIPPALESIAAAINDAAGVAPAMRPDGWLELALPAEQLTEVAGRLRAQEDLAFSHLSSVTAVDRGDDGFDVVYHLIALATGHKLVVVVRAPGREAPTVPSLTDLWPTANWQEREAYDLLGIHFSGHPDLRRILMREDWHGHPLRKDYEDQRAPRERVTKEAYR